MLFDIDWETRFVLTTISRADLLLAGFTQKQAAFLSDKDMRLIAEKMQDCYVAGSFWSDLKTATQERISQKGQAITAQSQYFTGGKKGEEKHGA